MSEFRIREESGARVMRRVGIPELGRMEAQLKELQAELDVANANLNTVRRQRRELEEENYGLRQILYTEGWTDNAADIVIGEMESECN